MKKILVLNHFTTVYPPTSGGTLRYFHLYQHLSRYYDITLLSQSHRQHREDIEYSPTFREVRVERDPLYKQLTRTLSSDQFNYEFGILIHAKLSTYPTVYRKYFQELSAANDLIIHESPYLLGYDQEFHKEKQPRIYNSHNHEFVLANQLWKHRQTRQFLPILYQWEQKLVRHTALAFATSEKERKSFITMYQADPKKIKLAPNGIDPTKWITRTSQRNGKPKALFIGANYPPNIEAADFIINHLADCCPQIEFVLAGGCCLPFRSQRKLNVQLRGSIDHQAKLKLFEEVDIAVNPMFTGTGVNLKTLEFLSAGVPLFSTRYGARGLNLIDSEHYIHAEKENFADKINQFYQASNYLKEIATRGQNYINAHYTWSQIASSMMQEIEKVKHHQ